MNPYNVQVASPRFGLQGLAGGLERKFQREDIANQKAEAQGKMDAQAGVIQSYMQAIQAGDVAAQMQIAQENPMMMQQLGDASKLSDQAQEDIKNSIADEYLNNGGDIYQLVARYGTAAKAAGLDIERLKDMPPEQLKTFLQTSYMGSEQFKRKMEMEAAKAVKAGGGDFGKIGQYNPKDNTSKSWTAFMRSGNTMATRDPSLLKKIPITTEFQGQKWRLDEDTNEMVPMVDATSSEVTDQTDAIADIEAQRQAQIQYTKAREKFRSNAGAAKGKISASRAKHKIMQTTADQIKKRLNNWSTKYGSLLSDLTNTEARTLSRLIDTLKANSAFTTLMDLKSGGGTLGAISEKELNLLESAMGAIDQGGDNAEMVRVIDQILEASSGGIDRLEQGIADKRLYYKGDRPPSDAMPVYNTGLPVAGMTDNGDGTFTLPDGRIVERE